MSCSKYNFKWSMMKGEIKMFSRIATRITILSLCLGMVLIFTGNASSAAPEEHKKSIKTVTGEVSTIRPTYISIISHKDEAKKIDTEMIFLIDENVTYKRKVIGELLEGDNVKITYDQYTKLDEEGNDIFVKRATKEIHFLSPKSSSLSSGAK